MWLLNEIKRAYSREPLMIRQVDGCAASTGIRINDFLRADTDVLTYR
jgi:hypothetical protein